METVVIPIAFVTLYDVKPRDSKEASFKIILSKLYVKMIENLAEIRLSEIRYIFKTIQDNMFKFYAAISKSIFIFCGNLEFVFF